ncbi:hypothetical protein [Cerasicoccus fimbriatus]|uniref:hypothetical protein n=1 Tax=Cerasicoccus fimbriatus TaxID=3014554 RepID=UPI0022B3A85E|nr:hypothetical protein [Cerasicoccus sp. TK19100]
MNTDDQPTPPPLQPKHVASHKPLPKNPTIVQVLECLLRSPLQLIEHFNSDDGSKVVGRMLLATVVCLGAFGFFVGTFSMGEQLWAAPLKIVIGLLVATLLCFPSLYIFSNLSGLQVSFRAVAGMLLCAVCMVSLLLMSFAPVVWLFSQSTTHLAFVGPLNLLVWVIALWFGIGLIMRGAMIMGAREAGYLKVWVGVFVLVLMQMSTSLRPIIGTADEQFTTEKVFFVQHWIDSLKEDTKTRN